MGIDYGMKHIGIALSDPQEIMAIPLDTILVQPDGSHIKAIHKIVDAYQVEKVVVGLPFNMEPSVCPWSSGTSVSLPQRPMKSSSS